MKSALRAFHSLPRPCGADSPAGRVTWKEAAEPDKVTFVEVATKQFRAPWPPDQHLARGHPDRPRPGAASGTTTSEQPPESDA